MGGARYDGFVWEGHGRGEVWWFWMGGVGGRGKVGVAYSAFEETAVHWMFQHATLFCVCITLVLNPSFPLQIPGTFTTASPVGGCTSTIKTKARVCLRLHRILWQPTGQSKLMWQCEGVIMCTCLTVQSSPPFQWLPSKPYAVAMDTFPISWDTWTDRDAEHGWTKGYVTAPSVRSCSEAVRSLADDIYTSLCEWLHWLLSPTTAVFVVWSVFYVFVRGAVWQPITDPDIILNCHVSGLFDFLYTDSTIYRNIQQAAT